MKHTEDSCDACGICCRLFLINLNEKEYRSGKYLAMFPKADIFDNFPTASECGANIVAQNTDGSCIYLTGGKCSIHSRRPQVCRAFFCKGSEPDLEQMRREIQAAKGL